MQALVIKIIFATVVSFVLLNSKVIAADKCLHLSLRTNMLGFSGICKKGVVYYDNKQVNETVPMAPGCLKSKIIPMSHRKKWSKTERESFVKLRKKCQKQMKNWYAEYLLYSKDGLRNTMVLFWHNHFTSSLKKVKEPQLIYKQHISIEKLSLGSFDELLKAILFDSAMLIYLDNNSNVKEKPNENFARELLELFTLGVGNYTEDDVKGVARSLTGLTVDKETFETVFVEDMHDKGNKIIFDKSGNYNPEAVLGLILEKPEAARYITEKIWSHFISVVDNEMVDELSDDFYKNWDIEKLVVTIIESDQFNLDKGQMIKSPLELITGTVRVVGNRMVKPEDITRYSAQMGMDLFDPPNVKGWPFGSEWVSSGRLLVRLNFLGRVLRGVNMNNSNLSHRLCESIELNYYTAMPPLQTMGSTTCLGKIEQLLSDPVWQLK
ncbi:DUF1800 domain-containing protein [Amphritea balenae]|uniref:DUF1800 domain-containing protein n=1 Tax=Amphritea balenae TaxID=452629 RepID=A0A3P1SSK2_9GAMM|nr:DUF1800 domain-containing protein [Amphritea balenae]RRD00177.1 DUF1800 domain-containing protein [Amphritea balenae]GGK77277.1 hypothetical protein GCM10007941_29300 [Amphritea balenae]